MPEIINFRNIAKGTWPAHAVRIDRATPWGNKFSHLDYGKGEIKVVDRQASVRSFEIQLTGDVPTDMLTLANGDEKLINELIVQREWIFQHIHELAGMDLVCWCHPLLCHGSVLLRLANDQ